MAVEDDPIYAKWRGALEHLIDADRRYERKLSEKSAALEAAWHDLQKAKAEFDEVWDELDDAHRT
jgi:hypothetical protein